MTTKEISVLAIFLFIFLSATAQSDTLDRFYKYRNGFVIEKIEREHIPLDGNNVKMIPFRVDNLFGFVKKDNKQKWVIQPEFEQVFAVYEEGAIVKKGYGYGLISEAGEWLIPPYYQNLIKEKDIFHGIIEGVIDTTLPEKYNSSILNQYFNVKGEFLFSQMAHDQQSFVGDDTLAWFRYGTRYHIRGKSGKLHKDFSFQENQRFVGVCDNLLVFGKSEDSVYYYFAYDLNNKLIFKTPVFNDRLEGIHRLSENLFGLIESDANYYFCDSLGETKSFGVFSYALGFFQSDYAFFNRDLIVVSDFETLLQGVINKKGEVLVEFKYKYIGEYINDLAFCISSEGKKLFIDNKGIIIQDVTNLFTNDAFEHSLQTLQEHIKFSEGLCIGVDYIRLKGDTSKGEENEYINPDSTYFFYFNIKGSIELEMNSDIVFVGYFSEGLAPAVNSKGKLGFIDKKGKWIILPEYELAMAGAYPFPYLVVPQFIGGYAYIKSFKGYIDKNGNKYFSGKRMKDHYDFSH